MNEEPSTTTEAVTEVAENITASAVTISARLSLWVESWGLPSWSERYVSIALLFLGFALFGLLIFLIIRPLVLHGLRFLVKKTPYRWDDLLFDHGSAKWASHFICGVLLMLFIPGLFWDAQTLKSLLQGATKLYLIISGFLLIDTLLNLGRKAYDRSPLAKRMPATSIFQVLKLIAVLLMLIMAISTLVRQSPTVFLSGLGVFASVIMLIFRDAILGFVAGIQLSTNRMLTHGDWIEMPKYGADGNVIEVGLTTVKVQNWDKTTTTIPTYALITDSFKNWRTMPESGGRRIKRAIHLDMKTIKLCDEEMLSRFRKIEHISEYIAAKRDEITEHNSDLPIDDSAVNGRRLTNVGTFRAYIEHYLRNHPNIHQEYTLLVRQLQPTHNGLPIEIYCFTNETAWARYEAIQADVFDHLLAVAQEFELSVFQADTIVFSPPGN
ncbi:MAG: mechanosensitive ion channel family protein [Verrucomicrobiota bacterium]